MPVKACTAEGAILLFRVLAKGGWQVEDRVMHKEGASFGGQVSVPDRATLRRFDLPGPRYTSYPTADRFVEAFDADAVGAGHDGGEAGHAQAAFEKLDRISFERDHGIDDYGEWNREAFTLGEGLLVHAFQQVFAIFQYR